MGRRKFEDRNIRKITKVGGTSLAVTLPVEVVKELGWKEKQKVVVKRVHSGVNIRDWRKPPRLKRKSSPKWGFSLEMVK